MTTTRSSMRRAGRSALAGRPGSASGGRIRQRGTKAAPEPGPDAIGTRRTIVIEHVSPELDAGRHTVKRVVGEQLLVTADIFADGHDLLTAVLLLRPEDEQHWSEIPMRLVDNDRWSASAMLERNVLHRYTVEAWRDAFGSLLTALHKKR